jgi:hypothetical protein
VLTIFTHTKVFEGQVAVIQRNAIKSWTLLRPTCEIILFGDDSGTSDLAAELGVRHGTGIARSPYGMPLVNDLFERAQQLASNDVLCYVNADIILMNDFMEAVEQVVRHEHQFLLVGRRWDVNVQDVLDFGPGWEEALRNLVGQCGELHSPAGIDYFVFSRKLAGGLLPFAIGHPAWDNWFLYRARSMRVPLIDATPVVMAVHQNHDYSYNPRGEEGVLRGPEAKRNLALAGASFKPFTVEDATHLLTQKGLMRTLDRKHLWRRLKTGSMLYPQLALPIRLLLKAAQFYERVRARLGFQRRKGTSRHRKVAV